MKDFLVSLWYNLLGKCKKPASFLVRFLVGLVKRDTYVLYILTILGIFLFSPIGNRRQSNAIQEYDVPSPILSPSSRTGIMDYTERREQETLAPPEAGREEGSPVEDPPVKTPLQQDIDALIRLDTDGRIDEAIALYESSVLAAGEEIDDLSKQRIYPLVINNYLKRWRFEDALRTFEEFKSLDGNIDEEYSCRIKLLEAEFHYYTRHFQEAMTILTETPTREYGFHDEAGYFLASSQYHLEQYQDAVESVHQLMDECGNDPESRDVIANSHLLLAEVYLEREQYGSSMDHIRKTVKLYDRNPEFFDPLHYQFTLGRLFTRHYMKDGGTALVSQYDKKAARYLTAAEQRLQRILAAALKADERIYYRHVLADVQYYLGLLSFLTNHMDDAENYFTAAKETIAHLIHVLRQEEAAKEAYFYEEIIEYVSFRSRMISLYLDRI